MSRRWLQQQQWSLRTHMKHEMLRPIWEKVGIGDPPVPYMNNPNESANARIKEKVDYKSPS